MKGVIIFLLLLCSSISSAQVLLLPQLSRTGILQKQQLWNMTLTNTGNDPLNGHLQIMMTDMGTGLPVLSAVGKPLTLMPGNNQVNATLMEPVQYTPLDGNYMFDPAPNGFLPFGNFEVCFSFFKHEYDAVIQVSEECDYIEVEPLSPPQLVLPWNEAQETQLLPSFNWLPPSPSSFFNNLRFEFDLVEINPGQSAADAIQDNLPLYHQTNLVQAFLVYPNAAPPLQYDKEYAWRISATSNNVTVSRSEVWIFSLVQEKSPSVARSNNLPYVKLVMEELPAYSVQVDYLKFEYINETADTAWKIKVYDLSIGNRDTVSLRWDTIPLRYGQNLVNMDLTGSSPLISNHSYLLELRNSREEIWRLRFEFRRRENNYQ